VNEVVQDVSFIKVIGFKKAGLLERRIFFEKCGKVL